MGSTSTVQLDVNNPFLNGFLDEEVYMTQPQGFEASDPTLVCKLRKALYGLKQAPRQWFERLKQTLLQFGFRNSKCDPSLFTYTQNGAVVYLLVCICGRHITGSSSSLVQQLITQLHSVFSLKQLGNLDYFLGIEVCRQPNGSIILTQSKYLGDLLAKTNMTEAKAISSPMASSCKLSKSGNDMLSDPTMYRPVVGALQYTTITWPELSFSVNKVCQFMANPLETHWTAVKGILRFLKGTIHHGLLLFPAPFYHPLYLRAFWNADWTTAQMTGSPYQVQLYILAPT